ncbi:uncharacterized protein LTR77_004611 [Saxophila tyrrhenica]|uniref:Uncharacterized protein n=1 Tax=Saxophila tyrrhenica TaxID=1690608 RepID=A0AAV9PDJ7_9PEZI|nr:hypothetical protein LTR77_004611 [Saxophila tyrrhenica]
MDGKTAFANIRKGPLKMSAAPLLRSGTSMFFFLLIERDRMAKAHISLVHERKRLDAFTRIPETRRKRRGRQHQRQLPPSRGGEEARDDEPIAYNVHEATTALRDDELHPTPTTSPFTRLRTQDPEHDAKRWMLTPNPALSGEVEDRRTSTFFDDPSTSSLHLRSTFLLGISTILTLHSGIRHLIAYLARDPYNIRISPRFLEKTDERYFHVAPEETFEHLTRDELVLEVRDAGVEIDFRRGGVERLGRRILRAKMEVAREREGYVERESLVEGGWVREEWVRGEWVRGECLWKD